MSPEEMVELAIEVADEGLAAGELPIGAVVVMGEEVVGRAYTSDRTQDRRLVHADLLAMEQADRRLGWRPRPAPVKIAVNLEPCLMCLGASMALWAEEFCFGLESPSDGAASLPASWAPERPDMPFSRFPTLRGGIHRARVRQQFQAYVETAPDNGFSQWARALLDVTT